MDSKSGLESAMSDRVREIQQRVEKATKGPWGFCFHASSGRISGIYAKSTPHVASVREPGDEQPYFSISDADADFIAHSREDIPYLVKELEAAEARIQSLTEAQRWIPVSEKPKRAGWYNVMRETDGHRSVRVWDDSDETWYYVGETHKLWAPNNAFTHWRPLPEPPVAHNEGDTKP